eukprot:11735056-Alexandrium_andersonii.AAC.1
MKVLWVARVARFDLLRAVGFLATKITKWTSKCDRQLYRLIGYMKHGQIAHGWLGWGLLQRGGAAPLCGRRLCWL